MDYDYETDSRSDHFITESEEEARKVMDVVKEFSDLAILYYVREELEERDVYESENLEKKLTDSQRQSLQQRRASNR